MKKFWSELKAEPVHEESKKIHIQFAMTCNKNEQQEDGKNNTILYNERQHNHIII